MKIKIALTLFLGILILPIFSIIVLSFQNNGEETFKWYHSIFINKEFTNAFLLSTFISILTAVLSVLVSFVISLSWFKSKQLFLVAIFILVLGLLPSDILALAIIKTSNLLGFQSSNLFLLVTGLMFYTFPFITLLFWTRFYFIDKSIIVAAKDIGMDKFYIIAKVILPLSRATTLTCFVLSFLLSFNELPRTYYLSGSKVLLTEYLNGKLNSGADESIYAGGGITILLTVVLIIGVYSIQIAIQQKKAKVAKPVTEDL